MKYLKIIVFLLIVVGGIYFFTKYQNKKVEEQPVTSHSKIKVIKAPDTTPVQKIVDTNITKEEQNLSIKQKNIPKYKDIFNDKKLKQIRQKAYEDEEHAQDVAQKSKKIIADTEKFLKEKNLVLPVQKTDPQEIKKLEKSLEDLKKAFDN